MRIHGNQANLSAVNPYSAAAEKAAAAQRAADVRKRLLKRAAEADKTAVPHEAQLVGKWMGFRLENSHEDVEYHAAAAGKDSDFE